MTLDRQTARWSEARRAHHEATQALREAQHHHERTGVELTTAGAALAERVRLLEVTRRVDDRTAA